MIALTTSGIRWMKNGTGKCSNGSMSKSQTKNQKRHRTRRSQACISLGRVKRVFRNHATPSPKPRLWDGFVDLTPVFRNL